ncbi:hypothetical protein GCM10010341_65600 [Streptomyces noursei]|nr:hypothetical protein GCM10010341_65600 [Streptomyces noursei]
MVPWPTRTVMYSRTSTAAATAMSTQVIRDIRPASRDGRDFRETAGLVRNDDMTATSDRTVDIDALARRPGRARRRRE